jgi:integrase
MEIEKILIKYQDPDSLRDKQHYVLISKQKSEDILLSHPNLYLANKTYSSEETSRTYGINIACFYNYLSTTEKFKDVSIDKYHVFTDNRDVRRWQIFRQIERVSTQSKSPTTETVYKDAKNILLYFQWLNEKGYATGVIVELKTWRANFKKTSLLSYIKQKSKTVIDSSNVDILDKERRQKKLKTLITNDEIIQLMESWSDPVYPVMFALGLGTAMRPMDLIKFPYLGVGDNTHIKPFSDMTKEDRKAGSVAYNIYGSKGNKDRTIEIPLAELKTLKENYTDTIYPERKKLYQKEFKKECPPSILFLNKKGIPITETHISNSTYYAVRKAKKAYPAFREGIDFYESRHWWPTEFILEHYKENLLTSSIALLDAAVATVITNQMGHDDISTTFKFYIDRARIMMSAKHGRVNEVLSSKISAIDKIKNAKK